MNRDPHDPYRTDEQDHDAGQHPDVDAALDGCARCIDQREDDHAEGLHEGDFRSFVSVCPICRDDAAAID